MTIHLEKEKKTASQRGEGICNSCDQVYWNTQFPSSLRRKASSSRFAHANPSITHDPSWPPKRHLWPWRRRLHTGPVKAELEKHSILCSFYEETREHTCMSSFASQTRLSSLEPLSTTPSLCSMFACFLHVETLRQADGLCNG